MQPRWLQQKAFGGILFLGCKLSVNLDPLKKVQNSSPRHTSSISKVGQLTMDAWGSALRVIDAMKSCVRWYLFGCSWLESASFTENLDESSASVKKRCKKYLNQVATMSCNVSQRVSRKAVWKITRVEVVHFEFLLRLWNWTIIGYYSCDIITTW